MRKLLTESEERAHRGLLWLCWVIFPIEILFIYCTAFADAWWQSLLFTVPSAAIACSCFLWCITLRRYIRRIKGNERALFMSHYYKLWEHTRLLTIRYQSRSVIDMVIQIKAMADIMEVEFGEAREFAFQHAGIFLDVPTGLPLKLPDVPLWAIVLKVLESDIEELPPYISHRDELVRKAAAYRVTHEKTT